MKKSRRKFLKQLGVVGIAANVFSNRTMGAVVNQRPRGAESFTINILQTTDVHCQIHAHDELFWEHDAIVFRETGGYARLAAYFKTEREKNPDTFILDTGDLIQGSELSVKTTGKALIPILNALDYDLFLPGNWEVIYYKKAMESLLGALHAPKICANMYHDSGDGKRGEFIFPPYHVWNVRGVKIGFIGYTDPMVPLRQSPNYSKGIVFSRPEENLAHYVSILRDQEHCVYVMIVGHLGLSQQIDLANRPECKGVDYILGGDTHERVRTPIVCKYAKVVEPGAFGSFVGKLNLTIENGKVISDKYELVEMTREIRPDTRVLTLIKNSEMPFGEDINKVIGYSTIPLYRYFVIENPIDTLILDALHWQLKDIDVVLSNGFRFCPPRATRDATGNIPITDGYIYDMLPVDSVVRVGSVTGAQLRNWLEVELNNVFARDAAERFGGWLIKFKGMEIAFDAFGEKGSRVKKATVGGEPLNTDKRYRICACERDGDPVDMLCRIKGVAQAENTSFSLHSVLRNYLAAHSPVTPTPAKSARVLDAPQTLLTQVSGVDYQFR